MQMSLLMVQLSSSSWSFTFVTAMSSSDPSSCLLSYSPTVTPRRCALIPSQQCPAVITLSGPTSDPPHIRDPPTPLVSTI